MADILTPDLCVIGGGSGGLAVAELARARGASVVLVERMRLGGSALHSGAIPARALVAAAAHAQAMRDGVAFGIPPEEPRVNFRRVHDHIEQVIATLAPDRSSERLAALGIEIVAGSARFESAKSAVVGETEIRARRFVIATGGHTPVPDIAGLGAVPYFTSETILDNTRKLTHLVVVGGGAAAVELAQAYRRLGSEVTVVAPGALLEGVDPELAAVALGSLADEGVTLLPHAAVAAIQARSMGIGIAVRSADSDLMLDASHILIAGERAPNLDGLDLDKAGVQRNGKNGGQLQLNGRLRTTNPRIYAVGDVAGGHSVPSARHQARIVVRDAFGRIGGSGSGPGAVPRLVSTDPPIAEVGLNEVTARTRHGIGFRVTRAAYSDNDQAQALRNTQGLAKLITDRSGRILGAGVVGPGAAELVSLLGVAMKSGMNARSLAEIDAPYPSYAGIAVRLGLDAGRSEVRRPLLERWQGLNRLFG